VPKIHDSAYGSKEDSPLQEVATRTVNTQLAEERSGISESADELALPEVTATPTKSQRNIARQKVKTPKTIEELNDTLGGDEGPDDTPVQSRSSGRQKSAPRGSRAAGKTNLLKLCQKAI
jgi:hypothetical protein